MNRDSILSTSSGHEIKLHTTITDKLDFTLKDRGAIKPLGSAMMTKEEVKVLIRMLQEIEKRM